MKNVETKIEGTKLTVTMDLTKDFGRSASGKTTIIASTEGNQKIATPNGEVTLGLNLYKK